MKCFEHFLITRFNVQLAWTTKKWNQDWIEHRLPLFEQFCYPSVQMQSNQNFKWIVLFDTNSPEFLKEKIRKYSEWKNFIPIYIDEFNQSVLRSKIQSYLSTQTKYLITTRLDNDDAICKDFVKVIQDNFKKQDFGFINFLYGYRWHKDKIYLHKYPSNSFISLIERIKSPTVDGFETVHCGHHHGYLSSKGTITDIKSKPAWIIVVHKDNIGNKVHGIRQPIKKLKDDFLICENCLNQQENLLLCRIEQCFGYGKKILFGVIRRLLKHKTNN
jgi:hypothetical protein